MGNILADANDILIDLNGNVSYLQDDKLWTYDASDSTILGASVVLNTSDLGVPDVDKLINFVDIDFIGNITIAFYFDGTLIHSITPISKVQRGTSWVFFPMSKRKPFQKLKLVITSSALTTKIYGIEIDFSVLRRRRYD